MATFSERYGYVPPRIAMQIDEITEHYRTDLWNSTYLCLNSNSYSMSPPSDEAEAMAIEVLHMRLDQLPSRNADLVKALGEWWASAKWYELYDAIEAILDAMDDDEEKSYLTSNLTLDFQKHLAPVRLIEGQVVKVDSDQDAEAVEDALSDTEGMPGARYHLEKALALLSDRESPDYPNSVKESISAVESVTKEITGKPKATLGPALDALKKSGVALHPSLIKGWQAMYGYASDADGIRHSASDRPKVDQAEARYWLVTCSAFVSLMLKLHREGAS